MNKKSPEDFVVFMNSLIELDPCFVWNLVNRRSWCNDNIANHPSVQVELNGIKPSVSNSESFKYLAGFLGVINGFWSNTGEAEIMLYINTDKKDPRDMQLKFYTRSQWQILKEITGDA